MKVWVITWESECGDSGIFGAWVARPTQARLLREIKEHMPERLEHLEEDELEYEFWERDDTFIFFNISDYLYLTCEEVEVA